MIAVLIQCSACARCWQVLGPPYRGQWSLRDVTDEPQRWTSMDEHRLRHLRRLFWTCPADHEHSKGSELVYSTAALLVTA